MKYLYTILVIGLLFLVVSGANDYKFFPNLPAVSVFFEYFIYGQYVIQKYDINKNKYIIFM